MLLYRYKPRNARSKVITAVVTTGLVGVTAYGYRYISRRLQNSATVHQDDLMDAVRPDGTVDFARLPVFEPPVGTTGEAMLALVDTLDFPPGALDEMEAAINDLRASQVSDH